MKAQKAQKQLFRKRGLLDLKKKDAVLESATEIWLANLTAYFIGSFTYGGRCSGTGHKLP